MSAVIREMVQVPGRYAVVGLPCFIKAIRLACRESPVLKERITVAIGLVCGHLKSTAFAELMAWQCDVAPSELRSIDFRTKLKGRPASSYAVTVWGNRSGQSVEVSKPTSQLLGSNWGHGLFRYKACDFCDDVVAETADISIGDAWLPEFEVDSDGTNVIVVRSQRLNAVLREANAAKRIHIVPISAERAAASQAGGFRHRRDGLALRLYVADKEGQWRPKKRVAPSISHLSPKAQKSYLMRYELAETSHVAFRRAKLVKDLNEFKNAMMPLIKRYDAHHRVTIGRRMLRRIKRALKSAADICNCKFRWLANAE
jgi:coenzyme F420-reducing hydrogenase beta subunit